MCLARSAETFVGGREGGREGGRKGVEEAELYKLYRVEKVRGICAQSKGYPSSGSVNGKSYLIIDFSLLLFILKLYYFLKDY